MKDARQRVIEALASVNEYRGTEAYSHMVRLLEAIEDSYRDDLLTLTPENLRFKQGAAKQVAVLRDALLGNRPGDIPKV